MPLVNAALVRWDKGYMWVEDPTSIGSWGRREGFLSLAQAKSREEAVRMAQAILNITIEPQVSVTASIEPTGAGDTPYEDFIVGDFVTAPDETDTPISYRVTSLAVTEDEMGNPTFAPTLGTRRDDRERKIQRWLKRMANGTLGGVVDSPSPPSEPPKIGSTGATPDRTVPPFSFAGPIYPAVSSKYSPPTPIRIVYVTMSLHIAGTSTTTVNILRGTATGTETMGSVSLLSGETYVRVAVAFSVDTRQDQYLQVSLVTAGTGAEGLTVQFEKVGD